MRVFATTRATRSILGAWTSLLVLLYAVAPGLHVHTCESGTHGAVDAVAVLAVPAADDHDAPSETGVSAHDCDLCRLMSQTGALTPDAATPDFVVATDLPPAVDVATAPFGEPLRDDLGRGPPTRTR